jgi:UDP-2-acetamido-3-amino-2,3-dideoxy-glucuronate N-acetyltransferase
VMASPTRADLRIAVIGLGRWGKLLMRVFTERADVTLACSRSDPVNVKWLADHHPGVRHTFDTSEVMADPTIDVVVIATTVESHAALALSALEAGKHVFVEKPLSMNEEECQRVSRAADDCLRVLFVGYVYLYNPAFGRLQSLLADDPPVTVACSWRKFGTFDEGLVPSLASHEISIACALFGERPNSVEVLESRGVETACDILKATLSFEGGRTSTLDIDRHADETAKIVTITADSGCVYVWEGARLRQQEPTEREIDVPGQEPLAREVASFLEAIRTGREPLAGGDFSIQIAGTMELIAAGIRS